MAGAGEGVQLRLLKNPDGTASLMPCCICPTTNIANDNSSSNAPAAAVDGGRSIVEGPTTMKRRGRPRKYGSSSLSAAAVTPPANSAFEGNGGLRMYDSSSPAAATATRQTPSSAVQEEGDPAFHLHVICVNAGEDLAERIQSFSQHSSRIMTILSATGQLSSITIQQSTLWGQTVVHEGTFDILEMNIAPLPSVNGTYEMTITFSGPSNNVMGGRVAGPLRALAHTQVLLGSFINADPKESNLAMQNAPVQTREQSSNLFGLSNLLSGFDRF